MDGEGTTRLSCLDDCIITSLLLSLSLTVIVNKLYRLVHHIHRHSASNTPHSRASLLFYQPFSIFHFLDMAPYLHSLTFTSRANPLHSCSTT